MCYSKLNLEVLLLIYSMDKIYNDNLINLRCDVIKYIYNINYS